MNKLHNEVLLKKDKQLKSIIEFAFKTG